MKKKLVVVLIICLSLLIFHNFLIRQYFISKIEYVDYDEYILLDYLNGKKNKASYVGADFMIVIGYNAEEKIECVWTYDYDKRIEYQYNMQEDDLKKVGNNEDRPINLNNGQLTALLKNNTKFKLIGTDEINNRSCYILEFKTSEASVIAIYLDKELLYTVKYVEKFIGERKEKNIINDYELDLELKHRDIFKEYIN